MAAGRAGPPGLPGPGLPTWPHQESCLPPACRRSWFLLSVGLLQVCTDCNACNEQVSRRKSKCVEISSWLDALS